MITTVLTSMPERSSLNEALIVGVFVVTNEPSAGARSSMTGSVVSDIVVKVEENDVT
jgi:hypothetical protein